ncbi:hypothetical protein EVAR_96687_1 [Eumeta japonica]|uniref:Uncharacterized protein n=1 Tax=Eumeta variegata TaxID=151549 RepID=A0A4C1WH07_EUMVA|nr:hypothetical protein EVAR_96687_1 [Eumeta japonica]
MFYKFELTFVIDPLRGDVIDTYGWHQKFTVTAPPNKPRDKLLGDTSPAGAALAARPSCRAPALVRCRGNQTRNRYQMRRVSSFFLTYYCVELATARRISLMGHCKFTLITTCYYI